MRPEEAARFEADPLMRTILLMRTWDEKAKRAGWKVPDMDSYAPLLASLCTPAPAVSAGAEYQSAPAPCTGV